MDYVDIIMPVHNGEEYIEEAINSIKQQTYKNWRLIIIDDASTDNTINVIENNINDIKNKVLLIKSNNNIGSAEARNLGIRKSNNRYIAFLDADDIWYKDKLRKQIEFMRKNNYSFTYTLFTYLKKQKKKEVKVFPKSLNYKQALGNTFILTSTVIIDTKYVSKEKIFMKNVFNEDTATWWQILKSGNIAYGLKENLTLYRIRKNSLSSNKFKNLKRNWNLYRKVENLSVLKSSYYFINYVINATIKRII